MQKIILGGLILLLVSCGSESSDTESNSSGNSTKVGTPEEVKDSQEELIKQTPQLQNALDGLQNALGTSAPAAQVFRIDPGANNTVETKSGAIIQIPANAFKGARSSVDVVVKEIFSPMDAVLSGMQTISEKGPLASDGMIFIDARSNGNSLELAQGKDILMSLPAQDRRNKDYQIFEGGKVPARDVVWKESTESKMQDYIIPFAPQYLLNGTIDYYEDELGEFRDRILYYHVSPELKDNPAVSKYNWWYYDNLDQYKNSLVVTREFASMFESTAGISVHDEVTAFYLEHSDKALWVVDSMYWPEYRYKDRKHGKVIKLDYDGIDLNENGHQKLSELGLSEEEIQITMFYHNQREQIMRDMDAENDRRTALNYNNVVLRSLGWINIDRYAELRGDELLANITVTNSTENTQVYLVNEMDKVFLKAFQKEGVFFFGKTPDDKVRLPLPAVIYAFDVIDGQFYFHAASPYWNAEKPISFELKPVPKEKVDAFLEYMKDL